MKVSISFLSLLNGVFHFMESYWSHYGVFNHFQLEKNEFSVVLMEFCYHLMATYGVFRYYYGVWKFSYEVLAPQCGVFTWSFITTKVELFFLTLTPFNGILLEFSWCVKNIEIRIYRKSAILWSNILRQLKALILHLNPTVIARKLTQPGKE